MGFALLNPNILIQGVVIKSTGSWFKVRASDGKVWRCVIKGKFRTRGIRGTNPVAVGDEVVFDSGDNSTGIIKEIKTRKNYIIRKSPKLSKQYQIIAANIDQAILMLTLREPETQIEFIDRFLVAGEAFRIPVKLVFNKTDVYTDEDIQKLDELIKVYEDIGTNCYKLSLNTMQGFNSVKQLFNNCTSLVAGNSGVGKTTLLMALDTALDLKVRQISKYHKQGRHTTTFAEMFQLPNGGAIIDTPGIKGFGLVEFDKAEIYHFFPEIFKISKKCKYSNCLHYNEPNCAVIAAYEQGEIVWWRYKSYLNIMFDTNSKYR